MREDDDQNASPQPRESDPIRLNVFGKNQSALYQAVSEADMSRQQTSEGECISRVQSKSVKHQTNSNFYLISLG